MNEQPAQIELPDSDNGCKYSDYDYIHNRTEDPMVNENTTTQRGMNEDVKLIEQPILLDTSRRDSGCSNDNKDTTTTG